MAARSIAVAGAGPAGLAFALMAARRGETVVVHERFETPGPVGSGFMLQPAGLAVLAAMGLEGAVREEGAVIRRLYGERADNGRPVLDVDYGRLRGGGGALGLHRASLFLVLHEACVQAGVLFETGFEVTGAEIAGGGAAGGRLLGVAGRRSARFDLLVDALGARSALGPVRSSLGYGALWATVPLSGPFRGDALEQRYEAARTMVGVMPTGRAPGMDGACATFFWSLRLRDHAAWREAGLEAWKDRVRRIWPDTSAILDGLTDPEQLVLARYAHGTRASAPGSGPAVIGDAAHCTSPQLGQGVNMGLLDAWALDRALGAHGDLGAALSVFSGSRWAHIRLYQALSQVFTPFYQSDDPISPAIRDHVLAWLCRAPFSPRLLAATVSGLLLDPRRALGL